MFDALGILRPWTRGLVFTKIGRNYAAEVSAIRLLRAQTTIPVPRVLFILPWGEWRYVVMIKVPGADLEKIWFDATDAEKSHYAQQLAGFVRQLRRLRAPFGSAVCSADGRKLWDPRIELYWAVGPFENENNFNQATILLLPRPHPPPHYLGHNIPHRVSFSHGDFAPRNIMVESGRVTAVIDWETAGWYPAHWEYVKSHLAEEREPWTRHIPEMIPSFEIEWEMEGSKVGICA